MIGRGARSALLAVAASALVAAGPLHAQEEPVVRKVPPPAADTAPAAEPLAADSSDGRPSPGGAFARSLIVPGWGQAAFGSYLRGGVYFAAHTGSSFMLFKTIAKLGEAKEMRSRRAGSVRDSLFARAATDSALAATLEDPAALEDMVEADTLYTNLGKLVEARKEQREDWIAWVVFWTLIGGVDAYVTAHLADFPVDVVAEPRAGGGARIGVQFSTGGPP